LRPCARRCGGFTAATTARPGVLWLGHRSAGASQSTLVHWAPGRWVAEQVCSVARPEYEHGSRRQHHDWGRRGGVRWWSARGRPPAHQAEYRRSRGQAANTRAVRGIVGWSTRSQRERGVGLTPIGRVIGSDGELVRDPVAGDQAEPDMPPSPTNRPRSTPTPGRDQDRGKLAPPRQCCQKLTHGCHLDSSGCDGGREATWRGLGSGDVGRCARRPACAGENRFASR